MRGLLSKYISKFFVQQWIIGVARGRMQDIIRTKRFDRKIDWMLLDDADKLYADPFLYKSKEGKYNILFEDYSMDDKYGKISVMQLDENLKQLSHKLLLDTKSHLSYPFMYLEADQLYVFPEAAHSGKLSCYKYDPGEQEMIFFKDIIDLPLLDATIFRYHGKYWLFGTLNGKDAHNKLYLFFSDSLLGQYSPHPGNPVKTGLIGTRPAGNIIEVDGVLYRPAQNSKYTYGESITLNKISQLNELDFDEEFYMTICLNKSNAGKKGMHGIHTINNIDDVIVVDGTKWRFSLTTKIKQIKLKLNSRAKRK